MIYVCKCIIDISFSFVQSFNESSDFCCLSFYMYIVKVGILARGEWEGNTIYSQPT